MPTNQITIVFTPCSPSPENGYRVFYREVGDIDFIEYPDAFTSSPIIFQVEGPTDQPYEGYIMSDCGEDVISEQVPFETVLCPPPEGCCDPVVIDAEAETIIPDGSGSGSVSGGEFLRLVFNVDMAGESVSDWNIFFDTATWAGTPFTSVEYSAGGTIVDLFGMSDMQIPSNTFGNDLTILKVIDFAGAVNLLQGVAFGGAENLNEAYLPACDEINNAFFICSSLADVYIPLVTEFPAQAFAGCTVLNETGITSGVILNVGVDAFNAAGIVVADFPSCLTCGLGAFRFCLNLTTVNLPVCSAVGLEFFRGNNSMTNIYMPNCSNFGSTLGDDDCFLDVIGSTFVLTIPTATATDGDIITAQANNSVTLILV